METMVKYIAMKTLENQHKEENENDPESHPSGFCPDPSIIRVEDDYYIANSSFEWWPGVKIYHSKT